jgi:hypothetical protein
MRERRAQLDEIKGRIKRGLFIVSEFWPQLSAVLDKGRGLALKMLGVLSSGISGKMQVHSFEETETDYEQLSQEVGRFYQEFKAVYERLLDLFDLVYGDWYVAHLPKPARFFLDNLNHLTLLGEVVKLTYSYLKTQIADAKGLQMMYDQWNLALALFDYFGNPDNYLDILSEQEIFLALSDSKFRIDEVITN